MALPKIDVPIYDLDLPVSKKHIRFRPFLVKEQKNLLMAMEAEDSETVESNIRQILINCTISEDVDIDDLPLVDIEYYFLNLRARSVGEIVELRYICNNFVDGKECGNIMETEINIFDVGVQNISEDNGEIQVNDKIVVKMGYPKFSVIKNIVEEDDPTEISLSMIVDCIEYIYDGEQYYYAKETPKQELINFMESLNQEQFNKFDKFFDNLPKLNKEINVTCSKCGFKHDLYVEGLENFFG